jgi:hypothetical protein
MSNINDGGAAFPTMANTGMMQVMADGTLSIDKEVTGGLTKRELFAGLAMQGTISGYWSNPNMGGLDPQHFASNAVACADALIAELAKGGDA